MAAYGGNSRESNAVEIALGMNDSQNIFNIDEMNESEIHSLKQDVKKLKLQIEERDFCIRELQKIIEQIQETLERDFINQGGDIYGVYRLTEKAVNSVILLCKNSADRVIEKLEENEKKGLGRKNLP